MKTILFRFAVVLTLLTTIFTVSYSQQSPLQYFRATNKSGLNVFETSKSDTVPFAGVTVRVGADFALQFQGITQENALKGDTLIKLANNFNLPTANLNLDVQLADGMRVHLRTYLSSRHHSEAWVKGGYLQVDKLDFIKPGFLSGAMKIATLRFGMDEINYGDTHFRRSDNARALYNPFVGNYIMDAFTTEPFAEVMIQKSGILGVLGLSNGRLNQTPLPGDDGVAFFAKLGYDQQVNQDLRVRITGSIYNSTDKGTRDYLYNGDRAGSRYYELFIGKNVASPSDFLPRYNPNFKYQTAFQLNPFVKFKGFEFFGVYELATNGDDKIGGGFNQLGGEALYRLGKDEQFYFGGRYNAVSGKVSDATKDIEINRLNVGGGWFMTKNVLTKVEYVSQSYGGDGYSNTLFEGAEANGFMIEAVISF